MPGQPHSPQTKERVIKRVAAEACLLDDGESVAIGTWTRAAGKDCGRDQARRWWKDLTGEDRAQRCADAKRARETARSIACTALTDAVERAQALIPDMDAREIPQVVNALRSVADGERYESVTGSLELVINGERMAMPDSAPPPPQLPEPTDDP